MDLNWAPIVLGIVGAYFIGSIPFGVLASKIYRVQDPRTTGSGNIGFTNVLRTSGKKVGALTLIGDAGKGFFVVWLARQFTQSETAILLIAAAVILGHIFSAFLNFQGGKGVATALAAIGGLDFILGLCITSIWVLFVVVFRYSSGGSIAAFLAFPVLTFFFSYSQSYIIFAIGISFLVIWRHKENIGRLLSGTEGKLGIHSS